MTYNGFCLHPQDANPQFGGMSSRVAAACADARANLTGGVHTAFDTAGHFCSNAKKDERDE